jgi:N-acetylglucosamine malate deacetylase 1
MMKILIFSPHPDDETLGCGGTLLKHLSDGDEIFWCLMTYGNAKMGHDEKHYSKWDNILDRVNKEYKVKQFINLRYPSGALDTIGYMELISKTKRVIDTVRPDIIYVNHFSDIHTDHRYTYDIVMSSSKNFNCPFIKKIITYETISETDFSPVSDNRAFTPNIFVDISDYMTHKLKIMKLYESEIMKEPMPRSLRSIKALASYRGSRIGAKYGEAFQLVFERQ